MLIIKAKGGLGNRILSAASFILYARQTGRDFKIDWRDGIYADFNQNAYDELFSKSFNNELGESINNFDAVIPLIWDDYVNNSPSEMIQKYFPLQHSNPWIYRKLCAPLHHQDENAIEVVWSYTSKLGRVKRFLTNKQKSKFLFREVLRKYFYPNDVIAVKVDELFSELHVKTLGVHIRYTDLKISYSAIFAMIEKCINKKNYRYIFLATDNQEVEQKVKAKFDNVITVDKRFADNCQQLHSPNNIESKSSDAEFALTELMALSKCDDLIYSSRSSFSRLAVLMGDFHHENLFDVDRYNLKIQVKNFLQTYI